MQTTDLLHLIYVFVPAPRVLDTRLEAAGREAEAFVKFVAETSKGSVDPPTFSLLKWRSRNVV